MSSDRPPPGREPIEDNPFEENPFQSPRERNSAAPMPLEEEKPRAKTWQRVVVILVAIILTPPAAAVAGFCCCTAGLFVGGSVAGVTGKPEEIMGLAFTVLFPLGAIAGIVLSVVLARLVLRALARRNV